MKTPDLIARNVVHRARAFVSSKKLKGAEQYLLARFARLGVFHASRRDPRIYMQAWLFDFLTLRNSNPSTVSPRHKPTL